MTSPDLPARTGNANVLSAVTPGGLPYPVSSDPANQGANAIKALALALDPGPWTPITLVSGFSGPTQCRNESGSTVCSGVLTGPFPTTPVNSAGIPAGLRPVFPPGSGTTFFQYIVAAAPSGNTGYVVLRVWGNGSITVVAVNGTVPSVDIVAMRWPNR